MENNDLLFWTDILSDHALFLTNALSPKEDRTIAGAEQFHVIFKNYNQMAAEGHAVDMHALKNDTARFITFKKQLVSELLRHNILLNFSPSFVNHMVNEAEEFMSLFHTGACPEKAKEPTAYIKIWLADASGHAATLASFLDLAEGPAIQRAQFYQMQFDKLGKKASELDMIRQNLERGVHTGLLALEATEMLESFIGFCAKTGDLLDQRKMMSVGTLSSAITDHFIKEHRYFIEKLKTCAA